MKIKHKGKTYYCDKCDKKCNSLNGLQYHTKSVHKNGTRYKCDVCEYSTKHKSHLTSHIKSLHLNEKFDCKICDYKAATKGCLQQHFDSLHQKNMTKCTECNRTLKKRSLFSHMKIYHSEQNSLYCCEMCPFQTIHKSSLKKHTKKVHQTLINPKIA